MLSTLTTFEYCFILLNPLLCTFYTCGYFWIFIPGLQVQGGGGMGNFDMMLVFFFSYGSPPTLIHPNAVYFDQMCYVSVTSVTLCNTC